MAPSKKPAPKSAKKSEKKPSTKPQAQKSQYQYQAPAMGAGMWPAAPFPNFTASTSPKTMESFMNKSQSQFDAFSKDQSAAYQDALQAYMKSGKIAAERMQDMMGYCMQMCQESSEKQAEAMKNFFTCKTVTDVTEAQSKFAQTSFDDMVQAMTKMTEMGIKCSSEIMEPFNDQFGKAMKKATETMAA
jgi:phasin family protein